MASRSHPVATVMARAVSGRQRKTMSIRNPDQDKAQGKPRSKGRALLLLVASVLLLALLLPGPHKPDSFRLTEPTSWLGLLQPDAERDSDARLAAEPSETAPDQAEPGRSSASRSVPAEPATASRRSEPASDPPEAATAGERSLADRARPEDADPDNENDEDGLSIAGTVFDDAGTPLPGIVVRLRGAGRSVTTDELGMFQIDQLETGEYVLSVIESDRHHGTRSSVMAGVEAADLHLQRKGRIEIYGRVVDFNGQPVADALVRVLGSRDQQTTDEAGTYVIFAELTRAGSQPVLDFTHADFRDVRKRVATDSADLFTPVRVDIEMDAEHERVPVMGWVSGPHGEAVIGARVNLSSQQPRAFHSTVSNEQGEFAFEDVEIGPRYRVRVDPGDESYKRYLSDFFPVGPDGAIHEVELDSSGEAELSGMLLDLEGRPVADLTIWLSNTDVPNHQDIAIQTDRQGYFDPIPVPAGTIRLGTRSSPSLSASGIVLSPGEERAVQIPLDWGKNWLLGRVVDQHGEPVPRATVIAQWQQEFPDVRSTSRRQTLTDLEGYFNFANLAAPSYQLTVQAQGFQTRRTEVPLRSGDEVVLELREDPETGPGGG